MKGSPTSSGAFAPTCTVSTSNTDSGSRRGLWAGPRPRSARRPKPTAGRGSSSPPTPSSASTAASSPTSGFPGSALGTPNSSPRAGSAGVSSTSCDDRHSGQSAEIDHAWARPPQRHSKTAPNPLSGGQEGRLTRRRGFNRKLKPWASRPTPRFGELPCPDLLAVSRRGSWSGGST